MVIGILWHYVLKYVKYLNASQLRWWYVISFKVLISFANCF